MPVILLGFLKEFWKPILVIVLVAGLQFLIWNHGRHTGIENCTAKYEKIIKQHDEELNAKVDKLNGISDTIAKSQSAAAIRLQKNITTILEKSNKEPIVIYKEGKCEPTASFVNNINDITKAANEAK